MKKKSLLPRALIIILIVYCLYRLITFLIVLTDKSRLNIIFYGNRPVYYSLGIGNISYVVEYSVTDKILVPGGYGYYRVGSLGKLVSLEKKPEIFKKTFSAFTGSFIDYFFYPKDVEIYHKNIGIDNTLPSFSDFFTSRSNANLIERIYLAIIFLQQDRNQLKLIDNDYTEKRNHENYYNNNLFISDNQGSFYVNSLRNEKLTVQIIYHDSYDAAALVGKIIEGQGIRVVDITKKSGQKTNSNCMISESYLKDFSKTSKTLALFFKCQMKKSKTEQSDIIFTLADIEKNWLIQ